MSLKVDDTLKVTIDKMAIGGSGVARHDGLVIFIPDAAPGDLALVKITQKKKSYCEAQILEVIKPGPGRRTPPCSVADRCGGCNWQHLTEEEQRTQKQLLVKEALTKFLPGLSLRFEPLKESPLSLRYRNRVQPKFHRGSFGFFSRRSHEIVPIDDCLITEEKLTATFPMIQKSLNAKYPDSKDVLKIEAFLDQQENPHWVLIGDEHQGTGFSQVNRFQNDDLIKTVLNWAGQGSYPRIFDLYAGSGNFTFPLAQNYRTSAVFGVELDSRLVQKGQDTIQQNPALQKQVKFYLSDVTSFLKRTAFEHGDLVILDPPRAGADEYVMRALANSPVNRIIYISCHPVSLARDLKYFFEAQDQTSKRQKLRLKRIQCFEMFPQTDHVETIAELAVDTP